MKKFAVFQSPLAEKKLFQLLEYLETEWGRSSRISFIDKFRSAINNLEVVTFSSRIADQKRGIHKGTDFRFFNVKDEFMFQALKHTNSI